MNVISLPYIQQFSKAWIGGDPVCYAWQMIAFLVLEQDRTQRHLKCSIASIFRCDASSGIVWHRNQMKIHILCLSTSVNNSTLIIILRSTIPQWFQENSCQGGRQAHCFDLENLSRWSREKLRPLKTQFIVPAGSLGSVGQWSTFFQRCWKPSNEWPAKSNPIPSILVHIPNHYHSASPLRPSQSEPFLPYRILQDEKDFDKSSQSSPDKRPAIIETPVNWVRMHAFRFAFAPVICVTWNRIAHFPQRCSFDFVGCWNRFGMV
jgi:hypothetical protein